MTTENTSGQKLTIVVHKKQKSDVQNTSHNNEQGKLADGHPNIPPKRKLILKGQKKPDAKRVVIKSKPANATVTNENNNKVPTQLNATVAVNSDDSSLNIRQNKENSPHNNIQDTAKATDTPNTKSFNNPSNFNSGNSNPNAQAWQELNSSQSQHKVSNDTTVTRKNPNDDTHKNDHDHKKPFDKDTQKDVDKKETLDAGIVDITTQKNFASINDRAASFYDVPNSRPNVRKGNLAHGAKSFSSSRDGRGSYDSRGDDGRTTRFFDAARGSGAKSFSGSRDGTGYNQRRFDNNKPGYGDRNNNYSSGAARGASRFGGNGNYDRSSTAGSSSRFSGAQARANYQKDRAFGTGNQGSSRAGASGGRRPFAQGTGKSFGPNGPRGFRPGIGAPKATANTLQNRPSTKRTFKGKKQIYDKHDEEYYDEEFFENKKKAAAAASVPSSIEIMETVSISDLAKKMNLKASDIIAKLMAMGTMVTITQSIDSDTATLLAAEYNCQVKLVSLYDETTVESDKGNEKSIKVRPPVVTVMGHVDHGKTKTLDAIRHTHIAEGEAGGITQSIGAYTVDTPKGAITFLDTPGHEAFTLMRARGAQVTDIVVLVVAADDGVMPQTLEAISHAKDAKVPIIVAVNKCDKPDANPDKVMTQLSEHDLTPEAWGGSTQYVKISALKKEGLDDLLDAILLQAEMLELKATYECRAEGKILESRIDQGRGVVSSVLVQRGTLKTGDPFVAGVYAGRVRAMFDDKGHRVKEATPSIPVEVLGMEEMPNAGDPFAVTINEKEARAISTKRQELKRFEVARAVKKVTLENLYTTIEDAEVKEFKVIIKADLQGSAEALKLSLEKLSTKDLRLVVIHSSAGAINESDVTLAAADSNAIIIGFNVRPTPKAKQLADQEKVEIRKYNIIYKCVEEIQAAMEGMLAPDTKENITGSCEVRNVYKIPKVGVIAGCSVSDGVVRRTSCVNLIRDGIVKYTGKIASLKHFKDDVKEMTSGQECGLTLENWTDIAVGDHLEIFEYVEVARKLGDEHQDARAENERKVAEGAKQLNESADVSQ